MTAAEISRRKKRCWMQFETVFTLESYKGYCQETVCTLACQSVEGMS